MRHPKNPFSPDRPADGAETADDGPYPWLRDRQEVSAEGMPGGPGPAGGGSGSPPLPRRTGDSGVRPYGTQAADQDFWPLTDPEDSWPLTPRPSPGPWTPGLRRLHRRRSPGRKAGPGGVGAGRAQEPWTQTGHRSRGRNGPQEPGTQNGPGSRGHRTGLGSRGHRTGLRSRSTKRARRAVGTDGPDAPGPRRSRMPGRRLPRRTAGPGITGTMLTCRNPGRPAHRRLARRRPAHRRRLTGGGPRQAGPPQTGPPRTARGRLGPRSPGCRPGPGRGRDQHARNARCPGMAGAPSPARHAGPPDLDEPWLRTAKPKSPRRRRRGRGGHSAPEPAYQDDLAPADGTHLVAAQAGQDAGAAPSMESQDLWESWEPPYNQAGAAPKPVLNRTAPYPELVRDAEYEDELWQTPGLGGAGGDGPRYPGQHRRGAHARNAGRPRMNGASWPSPERWPSRARSRSGFWACGRCTTEMR